MSGRVNNTGLFQKDDTFSVDAFGFTVTVGGTYSNYVKITITY